MIGKAASPSGGASAGADRELLLPATAELRGWRAVKVDPDHRCSFPTGRERRKQRIRVIECSCGQQWRWSETYAGDGWVKA